MRCTAISASSCLTVCLSVCPLACSLLFAFLFHQIFCTSYLWRAGSILLLGQCNMLCTSVLWMMLCFHKMEQMGQNKRLAHVFRPVRQVAAPGAKSAVSNCIVFSAVSTSCLCMCDLRCFSSTCGWTGRCLWQARRVSMSNIAGMYVVFNAHTLSCRTC